MAITLVQAKTAQTSGASQAISCSATGAGNLLVLFAATGQYSTNPTYTGPAGWTALTPESDDGYTYLTTAAWYLPNNAGGITSVTVTTNGDASPANAANLTLLEFSGVATSSPLDASTIAVASAFATTISESVTTTASGDLLLAFLMLDASKAGVPTITQPGGWTSQTPVTDASVFATVESAYKVAGAAGAQTYAPSWSISTDWTVYYLAFKAGGGVAPVALSGTAADVSTLAGTLTPPAVTLAGTALDTSTLAGALTPPAVALAGVATDTSAVAGTLTPPAVTLAGTATDVSAIAGALTPPAVALTGTAADVSALAGTLTPPSVALAGIAADASTLAGTLTPPTVTLAGIAADASRIAGTLTPPAVALSGMAADSSTLAGTLTGVVQLAGIAADSSTLTGALTPPAVALAGIALDTSGAAGTLTPPAMALSGVAADASTLAGALINEVIALAGVAADVSAAAGTLTPPAVMLSGVAADSSTLFCTYITIGVRVTNETTTIANVLLALSVIMPQATQLAVDGGSIAINDDSPLLLDTAHWPALLIEQGKESTKRIAPRTWQKQFTCTALYMARWDAETQTTVTLDAIWDAIANDVGLMIANITDNPTLTAVLPGDITATRTCLSVASVEPSSRTQKVLSNDYGMQVVERLITITVNMQPYLSVA